MQKYREYTVHYKQRRYSLFIASTTVAELLNDWFQERQRQILRMFIGFVAFWEDCRYKLEKKGRECLQWEDFRHNFAFEKREQAAP